VCLASSYDGISSAAWNLWVYDLNAPIKYCIDICLNLRGEDDEADSSGGGMPWCQEWRSAKLAEEKEGDGWIFSFVNDPRLLRLCVCANAYLL